MPGYIKKEDLSLNMIPKIKKGLAIAYLFDDPKVKLRDRTFSSGISNIE